MLHTNKKDITSSTFTLLEVPLVLFSIATISYHLCLVVSAAAGHIIYPFILLSAFYFYFNASRFNQIIAKVSRVDVQFLSSILILGVLLGLLLLIISRPDADDVQFFYLPLLQLNDLSLPFLTTNEFHEIKQLPRSSAKAVEFYPFAVALMSSVLNIDPLQGYHNVSIFLATIGLIIVYAGCYRELSLSRKATLLAIVFAILFLFIDGNVHRSFGNVSLVRLWQGKIIMWTALVPLSMMATHRYIQLPTIPRYVFLVACSISAIGLSGTGLFLVPATIFASSLACFVMRGARTQDIKRCVIVNTSFSYSILVLAAMLFDLFPTYPLANLFSTWGTTWIENLTMVIPDTQTLIRNSVLLLLVPVFAIDSSQRKFIPLITLSVVVLYLNPISGPIIFETITGGSYWRFVYILPVPLAAGLIGILILRAFKLRFQNVFGLCVGVIAMASIAVAYQGSVLNPPEGLMPVWSKKITEYRFHPRKYESSEKIASNLKNTDHLLAPQEIINIVPLLKPTISLEAARGFDTRFVFANAGLAEEGIRRVKVQQLVTNCNNNPASQRALAESIVNGLTAIVVSKCDAERKQILVRHIQSIATWKHLDAGNGYTLLLRDEK